jgi:hypothetical protein
MVASALREWLPAVIQSIDPFMSKDDIEVGSQWFDAIGRKLRESTFVIICVTPDNHQSTWLHFEAGAIGMARTDDESPEPAGVVPYLLALEPGELKPPLSLYQAVPSTKDETFRLVERLNDIAGGPLKPSTVETVFMKWWPDLETRLVEARTALVASDDPADIRSDRDMIDEILTTVRGLARAMPRAENDQLMLSHWLSAEPAGRSTFYSDVMARLRAHPAQRPELRLIGRVMKSANPELIDVAFDGLGGIGVWLRPSARDQLEVQSNIRFGLGEVGYNEPVLFHYVGSTDEPPGPELTPL